MATTTANSSITTTGLTYRGGMRDTPYTGSVALRSIKADCDGAFILYWENGLLIGQFWSTTRTLDLVSDLTKLTYSADKTTVTQDTGPIKIKPGEYFARFYHGSSAYYTHAAIRHGCGCGWCPEPCDRIWTVGSSIQAIHEAEKRIPEYDSWIPMAYYLGVYGGEYAKDRPGFASTAVKLAIDSSAGANVTTASAEYSQTPSDLEFLDMSAIDFCADPKCEQSPVSLGNSIGPKTCNGCGKPQPKGKPQSCDCGCR